MNESSYIDGLFEAFERSDRQLYLVGGAVRDRLMGTPLPDLEDLDFATDASPEETLRLLKANGFPTYEVGRRFGTIGTLLRLPGRRGRQQDCQITTFRSAERYARGSRHPQVEFGRTIEDDLWRRDFSVNSIAQERDGSLVDPYRGRDDIEAGVLRAVGDPLDKLRDDPLRILRIGRFISQLGFRPDEALSRAATERAESILEISRERWLQEMSKLLVGAHCAKALGFLLECRVLGMILPEVAAMAGFHDTCPVHHKDLWAHTLGVLERCPADEVLRWAALVHDAGKVWTRRVDPDGQVSFLGHEAHGAMLFEGIASRFRIDRRTTAAAGFAIRHHDLARSYRSEWTDTAVRRFVRRAGDYLEILLAFARADLTTADPDRREAVLARVDDLEGRIGELERAQSLRPRLPTGLGHAVMAAFGLSPGPEVGILIERVREAALEGVLPAEPSVEACIEFLEGGSQAE